MRELSYLEMVDAEFEGSQPISPLAPVKEDVVEEEDEWAEPVEYVSLDQVKSLVPKSMANTITPSLIKKLNDSISDPAHAQTIRDNFLGYTKILGEGKYRIEEYLSAVKYVSFKLMDYTNKEAFERTFPEKIIKYKSMGKTEKDISSFVAAYSKTKLVNLILEQSLVPFHILNQEYRQFAVNALVKTINTTQSDKVKVDAASALLTHLAPPKDNSLTVKINTSESKEVQSLRDELTKLAELQRGGIIDGKLSTKEVAASRLIQTSEDIEDAEEL